MSPSISETPQKCRLVTADGARELQIGNSLLRLTASGELEIRTRCREGIVARVPADAVRVLLGLPADS